MPQTGNSADRQLIYIDRNRDMYIMPVMKRTAAKLASMVDSVAWHDSTGMLSALVDQKLVCGGDHSHVTPCISVVINLSCHCTNGNKRAFICAISDLCFNCHQTVWYYPNEVYGDRELLIKTKYIKSDSDFGKAPSIALFTGSKCLIRRSDGALVTVATSPYPLMLYDLIATGQWDKATRLCRFIKVGGPNRGSFAQGG